MTYLGEDNIGPACMDDETFALLKSFDNFGWYMIIGGWIVGIVLFICG